LLLTTALLALAGCRGGSAPPAAPTEAQAAAAPAERPAAAAPVDVAATPPDLARKADCCKADETDPTLPVLAAVRPVSIPDVRVLDQDGREVRFYEDLVKGKVVAINFVFTTCKAACPLLGAGFKQLQEKLGDRLGKDCTLISVSVDPVTDRPERLKEWAAVYGARPGWTLVTSTERGKPELDRLLKALQVYSPVKTEHSQSVLVVDGDAREGWTSRRIASADEVLGLIDQALKTRGGRNYFTDTTLTDQDGRRLRFYSDLVRGKVVVIHPFFTSCTGSCVVTADTMTRLQKRLGDRLGKDVVFLSLTVDPATDTPEQVAAYARRVGAKEGWHLLTGSKAELEQVERRLGQWVEQRESHATTIIVGNEASGLWLKHNDPRDFNGLLAKVNEALADVRGLPAGGR
jgi:cytochrome oxidase Cu insertion factor (SCO1/SenC/PrrC family)